ncbi:MAG: TIM barrel protein, partial [Pseudomonadota bacterium]
MSVEFSANLGFLWKDRPFLERIAAAKAADFPFVEFHDQAQDEDPAAIRAALAGTPVVGLNVRHHDVNGLAALEGREAEASADIAEAVATAKAIDAGAVHIMSGRNAGPGGAHRLAARLIEAADASPDLTFLIEPICDQAVPGYFLGTVEQAAEILAKVGRPNVKIMFDCFHVQRAGGDILARYRTHKDVV